LPLAAVASDPTQADTAEEDAAGNDAAESS